MSEKLKASRYNHFVPQESGKVLAFNALSCGLGEMDAVNYRLYQRLATGETNGDSADSAKLLEDLKKGGFLIPEDLDELDAIRAAHYQARFGNNGFGLTIIPTVNCNFACDYCYESREIHSLPKEKGAFMSDEVCDNIVKLCEKRIPEKSAFSVTWYGGEPLLATAVIDRLTKEFVRICDSKQSKYHAGIITNGYLLSKENLDFLIKSYVTFAQVTVDGPEEVHDRRRCLKSGGPTYRRIMENLANIEEGSPFRVSIRVNIDKRNSDAIQPLLEDLKVRGFHQHKNISVYFSQVVHYTNSCPDIASQCMVTQEFSEFMVEAYEKALEAGFMVKTLIPMRMLGSCGAVTAGGAVVEPCGAIKNCWNAVGSQALRTGLLTAQGINHTIIDLKWLGWTPFNEKCDNCNVLPICMGGCPYMTLYARTGDENKTQVCAWWKFNLGSVLKVIKKATELEKVHICKSTMSERR